MKSKSAFTLVEIIFVIMIVGILAVVAIPRLSATRDDAKITVALNDMETLVDDFSNYYTTKSFFSSKLEEMTHKTSNIEYTTPWNSTTQTGTITYFTLDDENNLEECVDFHLSNAEGNMTIEAKTTYIGTICRDLQATRAYKQLQGEQHFGGSIVKF
jgi:prepilin-type N-terminal cleavage/methylation domain-containing protein